MGAFFTFGFVGEMELTTPFYLHTPLISSAQQNYPNQGCQIFLGTKYQTGEKYTK
jgi:hypothetical protein